MLSAFARMLKIESVKGTIDGKSIYVSTQDNWGLRKVYLRKSYDVRSIEKLKNILTSDKNFVFWDLGANYGTFTLLLSPYADTTIAVEPSKRTFRHLAMSCAELTDKVILENCAASDRIGDGLLYLASGHSGDNRIYRPEKEDRRPTEPLKFKTVDRIAAENFAELPKNNLMKIDVQGSECQALAGAKQLIQGSSKIYVLMEVWPKGLREAGDSLDELVRVCGFLDLTPIDDSYQEYTWDQLISRLNNQEAEWRDVLLTNKAGCLV